MVIIIIQGEIKNSIGHDCCFIVECRMLCFNCKLWNDEEMKCEEGIEIKRNTRKNKIINYYSF